MSNIAGVPFIETQTV